MVDALVRSETKESLAKSGHSTCESKLLLLLLLLFLVRASARAPSLGFQNKKRMPRGSHTCPRGAPGKKSPGRSLRGQSLAPGLVGPGDHAGRSPPRSSHGPKRTSPHLSGPGSGGRGKGRPSLLGAHLPRPRPRHASGPRRWQPPAPCFRPLPEAQRSEKGSTEERDAIQLRNGAAHPGAGRRDRRRRGWMENPAP